MSTPDPPSSQRFYQKLRARNTFGPPKAPSPRAPKDGSENKEDPEPTPVDFEDLRIGVSMDGIIWWYKNLPADTLPNTLKHAALRRSRAVGFNQAIQRNYILSGIQYHNTSEEPLQQDNTTIKQLLSSKKNKDPTYRSLASRLLYIHWTEGTEGFDSPAPTLSPIHEIGRVEGDEVARDRSVLQENEGNESALDNEPE